MLAASVVLLLLGVTDGLSQTCRKGFVVRAVDLHPLVIILEVVDLLNLLELHLESILKRHLEASMIIVQRCLEGTPLPPELSLNHLTEGVEDHCYLEASKSGLEADLCAGVFQNDLLVLVLLVGVVQLWDLPDDPEGLSI